MKIKTDFPIVIKKFGGTSVGHTERIRIIANLIKKDVQDGKKVVAVVSAMAGETNRLVHLMHDLGATITPREYDVVVSSGEQVACGLLATALNNIGVTSESVMGWQIPIVTDDHAMNAKIIHINHDFIHNCLRHLDVLVVAGFQGVSKSGTITTIGRGGSDTSAVAIAAALKATQCDIYTDVEGVYSGDPAIVMDAKKIASMDFDDMQYLSEKGAKIVQKDASMIAKEHNIPLHIRSSFYNAPGTMVRNHVSDNDDIDAMDAYPSKPLNEASSSVQSIVSSRLEMAITFDFDGGPFADIECRSMMAEYGLQSHLIDCQKEPRARVGDDDDLYSYRLTCAVDQGQWKNSRQSFMDHFQWTFNTPMVEKEIARVTIVHRHARQHHSLILQKILKVLKDFDAHSIKIACQDHATDIFVDPSIYMKCTQKMHDIFFKAAAGQNAPLKNTTIIQ